MVRERQLPAALCVRTTVVELCVSVNVSPESFHVTEPERKSLSQVSAPSRGGGHAIIVVASFSVVKVSSTKVAAPLCRLQPAVAEIRPASGNATCNGPPPGSGYP